MVGWWIEKDNRIIHAIPHPDKVFIERQVVISDRRVIYF